MASAHDELLNTIKLAIDQLGKDESVPRRQTLRELIDLREYLGSTVDIIRHHASGGSEINPRITLLHRRCMGRCC
jgi:hypothetical protein